MSEKNKLAKFLLDVPIFNALNREQRKSVVDKLDREEHEEEQQCVELARTRALRGARRRAPRSRFAEPQPRSRLLKAAAWLTGSLRVCVRCLVLSRRIIHKGEDVRTPAPPPAAAAPAACRSDDNGRWKLSAARRVALLPLL